MCKAKLNAGRPKRTKIESARAAFWVSNLCYKTQKSFSDLERELYPEQIKKRDGGGYTQPYAFAKYSNGSRIPNHKYDSVDSPVIRAEKRYRGTQAAYDSILWKLMTISNQEVDTKKFYSELPDFTKIILKFYKINLENRSQLLLTDDELTIIFNIKNIDMLGLMLLQIKSDNSTIRYELIYLIREWLLKVSLEYVPFKMCSNLIFEAIEENLIELGDMTGEFGLKVNATDEEKHRLVLTSGIFSGNTILMKCIDFDFIPQRWLSLIEQTSLVYKCKVY